MRARLAAAWPRLAVLAVIVAAFALVVAGIAFIYPPLGLISGGVALLAILTFDPTKAGKLTWPR